MASSNQNLTLEIHAIQAPFHICWFTFSFIGGIGSFIVFLIVKTNKHMHTKSQLLVASMALADIVYCLSFFGTGVHRYIDSVQGNLIENPLFCALRIAPFIFITMVSNNFRVSLSIDRLLGLAKPIFYQSQNMSKYIFIFNCSIWICSLIEIGLFFFGYADKVTMSICNTQTIYTPWYSKFSGIISLSRVLATILIYAIALSILWRRLSKIKNMNQQDKSKERKKLELGTFRTLMVIVMFYIISSLTGWLCYLIFPLLKNELIGVIYAPAVSLLIIFEGGSTSFILTIMSVSFREALFLAIRRSNKTGAAYPSTSKNSSNRLSTNLAFSHQLQKK